MSIHEKLEQRPHMRSITRTERAMTTRREACRRFTTQSQVDAEIDRLIALGERHETLRDKATYESMTQNEIEAKPCETTSDYVGRRLFNVEGTEAGTITAVAHCQMVGCNGVRLYVKWPDGKRTQPCSRGCIINANGTVQIVY